MHYLADIGWFLLIAGILLFVSLQFEEPFPSLKHYALGFPYLLGLITLAFWVVGMNRSLLSAALSTISCLCASVVVSVAYSKSEYWQRIKGRFQSLTIGAREGIKNFSGLDWLLVCYLFASFALTFVLTLAPPSGNDYDSLVYHLAAPAQYLRKGRIVELPYDHHTYFPFLMEMLFLIGLWLQGPVLAKLFHWLMLPLCCGVLVLWGKHFLSLRAGLFAACLFASLPVVQGTASTAYVDLGLAAWVLLAFYCFSRWLETREPAWLGWCGAFCGFAMGTKYLGVLTFGFLLAWAVVLLLRERKFAVRGLAWMVGLALLLGGGWYVRNWLWTGNPVFPFAYGLFGGKGWTAAMAAQYSADQAWYGFGRGPLDWLLLPWRVSMTPLNVVVVNYQAVGAPLWPVSSEPITGASPSGLFETRGLVVQTMLGPALLALGAPLLLMRRKPPVIGLALWGMAFFWLFWTVTGQYLRYLIPAFAVLCLPCGWALERYLERSAVLKWTAALTAAAWLLFTPLFTLQNAWRTLPVIAGAETLETYLTRTFSGYAAMQWSSTRTPSNALFAIYGEPRCFYLDRAYFWADDQHNNLINYNRVRSGADLVRALREQGATHVLWNTEPARNGGAFGPPQPQMDEAINSGLLRRLFSARGYEIFEIMNDRETP